MGSGLRSLTLRSGRIGLAVGMLTAVLGLCVANPLVVCVGSGLTLMGGYLALFGEVGSF